MGLFDFLKPTSEAKSTADIDFAKLKQLLSNDVIFWRVDSVDDRKAQLLRKEIERDPMLHMAVVERDPLYRKVIIGTELEYVAKQVENLRNVGRAEEAQELAQKFLNAVFVDWKTNVYDESYPSLIAQVALRLNIPTLAIKVLEEMLASDIVRQHIDATMIFFNLGRLYHAPELRFVDPKKELSYYRMATKVKPPANCRSPATKEQKAQAHLFAYLTASRLGLPDSNAEYLQQAEWHKRKIAEIMPSINMDAMNWKEEALQLLRVSK